MVGRIIDISRGLDGKFRILMEVNDFVEFMEGDLDIEIQKHREKRSQNANAYFHVLVGKIADALNISKPKCKNILLGKYGQREILEDGPIILSIYEHIDMFEREDIHCIPVGHGEVNGKAFTHWAVLKPSHEYDSREMSILIDGTVDDAKELGIETLTPNELERMKMAWRRN